MCKNQKTNELQNFSSPIQKPLKLVSPIFTGQDCRASKPVAAARFFKASYIVSSKPTRVSRRSSEALEKITKCFPASKPRDGVCRKATADCSSSSSHVASSAVAGFLMISSLNRLCSPSSSSAFRRVSSRSASVRNWASWAVSRPS